MEHELTLQLLEMESVRCVQREKTECKCGPCFETTCSQMSLISRGPFQSVLTFCPPDAHYLEYVRIDAMQVSNVLLTTLLTI